jgi:hypothetical protein
MDSISRLLRAEGVSDLSQGELGILEKTTEEQTAKYFNMLKEVLQNKDVHEVYQGVEHIGNLQSWKDSSGDFSEGYFKKDDKVILSYINQIKRKGQTYRDAFIIEIDGKSFNLYATNVHVVKHRKKNQTASVFDFTNMNAISVEDLCRVDKDMGVKNTLFYSFSAGLQEFTNSAKIGWDNYNQRLEKITEEREKYNADIAEKITLLTELKNTL